MKKKAVSAKKQKIRDLFKAGVPVAKIAKKVKLSESGVRWHLNN